MLASISEEDAKDAWLAGLSTPIPCKTAETKALASVTQPVPETEVKEQFADAGLMGDEVEATGDDVLTVEVETGRASPTWARALAAMPPVADASMWGQHHVY